MSDGKHIETSIADTIEPPAAGPHHLDWDGCTNARDVGDLPTRDGRTIRAGALIRADSLQKLTPAGLAAARDVGIGRVIDLRRPSESAARPHPFADGPEYLNVPVQDPADPDHQWLELTQIYMAMIDLRPALFAAAIAAIAAAPEGAVVVHCAGGKDRTGLVIALALTVAGVEPEAIAADYALSEARLRDADSTRLEAIADAGLRATAAKLAPTPASNMLDVLAHIEQRYGGVERYLQRAGLTDAQLETLRTRLVA